MENRAMEIKMARMAEISAQKKKNKTDEKIRTQNIRKCYEIFLELLRIDPAVAGNLQRPALLMLVHRFVKLRYTLPRCITEGRGWNHDDGSLHAIHGIHDDLMDATNGFLLIVDNQCDVLFASRNTHQHLGLKQMKIFHDNLDMLVHEEDQPEVLDFFSKRHGKQDGYNFRKQSCRLRTRLFNNKSRRSQVRYQTFNCTFTRLETTESESTQLYGVFAQSMPTPTSYLTTGKSCSFVTRHSLDFKFIDDDDVDDWLSKITRTPLKQRLTHPVGYTKKDLAGRSFFEYCHPLDISRASDTLANLGKLKIDKVEFGPYRFLCKRGGWVNLVTQASRVSGEGYGEDTIVFLHYISGSVEHADKLMSTKQLEDYDPIIAMQLDAINRQFGCSSSATTRPSPDDRITSTISIPGMAHGMHAVACSSDAGIPYSMPLEPNIYMTDEEYLAATYRSRLLSEKRKDDSVCLNAPSIGDSPVVVYGGKGKITELDDQLDSMLLPDAPKSQKFQEVNAMVASHNCWEMKQKQQQTGGSKIKPNKTDLRKESKDSGFGGSPMPSPSTTKGGKSGDVGKKKTSRNRKRPTNDPARKRTRKKNRVCAPNVKNNTMRKSRAQDNVPGSISMNVGDKLLISARSDQQHQLFSQPRTSTTEMRSAEAPGNQRYSPLKELEQLCNSIATNSNIIAIDNDPGSIGINAGDNMLISAPSDQQHQMFLQPRTSTTKKRRAKVRGPLNPDAPVKGLEQLSSSIDTDSNMIALDDVLGLNADGVSWSSSARSDQQQHQQLITQPQSKTNSEMRGNHPEAPQCGQEQLWTSIATNSNSSVIGGNLISPPSSPNNYMDITLEEIEQLFADIDSNNSNANENLYSSTMVMPKVDEIAALDESDSSYRQFCTEDLELPPQEPQHPSSLPHQQENIGFSEMKYLNSFMMMKPNLDEIAALDDPETFSRHFCIDQLESPPHEPQHSSSLPQQQQENIGFSEMSEHDTGLNPDEFFPPSRLVEPAPLPLLSLSDCERLAPCTSPRLLTDPVDYLLED